VLEDGCTFSWPKWSLSGDYGQENDPGALSAPSPGPEPPTSTRATTRTGAQLAPRHLERARAMPVLVIPVPGLVAHHDVLAADGNGLAAAGAAVELLGDGEGEHDDPPVVIDASQIFTASGESAVHALQGTQMGQLPIVG
jgi:hypothetical protein